VKRKREKRKGRSAGVGFCCLSFVFCSDCVCADADTSRYNNFVTSIF
jgi:hypothetical protein